MKCSLILSLLLLTACGSGGGSDAISSDSPAQPVLNPVAQTADLTFLDGNGYTCYLDQGTVSVRASTLWCWGNNAVMGIVSASPVAYVTKAVLGGIDTQISNLNLYNDLMCFQTHTFQSPYNKQITQSSFCIGAASQINQSSFGGQNIQATPTPVFITQEMSFLQAPIVGADMLWNSLMALSPLWPGNSTAHGTHLETCNVSGTVYSCPSATLNLQ